MVHHGVSMLIINNTGTLISELSESDRAEKGGYMYIKTAKAKQGLHGLVGTFAVRIHNMKAIKHLRQRAREMSEYVHAECSKETLLKL